MLSPRFIAESIFYTQSVVRSPESIFYTDRLFNRLEKGVCLACVAPRRFLHVSSVLSLLYALFTVVEALFAFLPSLQSAAKSVK